VTFSFSDTHRHLSVGTPFNSVHDGSSRLVGPKRTTAILLHGVEPSVRTDKLFPTPEAPSLCSYWQIPGIVTPPDVKLRFSEEHCRLVGGAPFQTVHGSSLPLGWLHPKAPQIAA